MKYFFKMRYAINFILGKSSQFMGMGQKKEKKKRPEGKRPTESTEMEQDRDLKYSSLRENEAPIHTGLNL